VYACLCGGFFFLACLDVDVDVALVVMIETRLFYHCEN
jgi:hypothetical protein